MFATPVPPPCPSTEATQSSFLLSGCLNGSNSGLSVALSSQQIKDTLGVILPPSNIKGIIDKTAEFVAKNGLEFEQRVLADRSNGSKFAFLVPGNPYRPYYDAKVLEFQTGEVKEEVQQQIPQAILEIRRREQEKKQKKEQLLSLTSAYNPIASRNGCTDLVITKDRDSGLVTSSGEPLEEARPPAPPPEDQYSAPRPAVAPIDMDIIKLTAQYVARNGQRFLVALGQRERGNLQFNFLRMNHPLFPYFTALVDAYSRCLVPPKGVIAGLKEDIGLASRFSSGQSQICEDQKPIGPIDVLLGFPENIGESQLTSLLNIFERVDARHQWERYEEKRNEEEAKREADERQKMHAMDWHEFTVVEVIHFTEEDENLLLGAPLDQAYLVNPVVVPLAQSTLNSFQDDLKKAHLMDDTPTNYPTSRTEATEKLAAPAPPHTEPPPATPVSRPISLVETPLFPSLVTPIASTTQSSLVASHSLSLVAPQGGFSDGPPEPAAPPAAPIVVVKDYVRQGKRRAKESGDMQKCPITGQWIPVEKMSEHLRILLLDPKWKEEKDILLAKAQKESAFTCLSDFEANLANFVVKRPDLFGTVEDECESNYVPPIKRHS